MSSSLLMSATRQRMTASRNLNQLPASVRSASSALAKHHQSRLIISKNSSVSKAFFSSQPIEDEEPESFLTGSSSLYAEQMYEMYERDPHSVHESWRQYFDNLSQGVPFKAADYSRPSAVASRSRQALAAAVSKIVISGMERENIRRVCLKSEAFSPSFSLLITNVCTKCI